MNIGAKPMATLTPENAHIFRIIHRDNLPWILDHGLHCANSRERDPSFVAIGNEEVISMRATRPVGVAPGGTIGDYVAFYFTPCSLMLYNIVTGWRVKQRARDEIIILVSSLRRVHADGIRFAFTDRNAVLNAALYSNDLADLSRINWTDLQNRDFKIDPERPDKKEKYMAEALIHQHLPVDSLLGIVCYNAPVESQIKTEIAARHPKINTAIKPGWYF